MLPYITVKIFNHIFDCLNCISLSTMKYVFDDPLSSFNHLTTDDAFWYHLTLATCYQLLQSVLKIGFALANKCEVAGGGMGEVG